jgi:predicted tellurium resistance membrane protein TerC
LWLLPAVFGAAISVMALLLAIVATVFGRVVIFATTGRWLRRKVWPRLQSDALMLLFGVGFWIVLSSIPYIWPFVQAGLLVASLGIALTARYRVGWKKTEASQRSA